MAQIRLRIDRHQDVIDDVPHVCMKCGADAVLEKKTQFAWYPPWIWVLLFAGVLPYIILVMVLTRRQRVVVPLCDQHKNHFLFRRIFRALGYVGLFFGAPGIFVLGFALSPRRGELASFLCVGWMGLIFLYFFGLEVWALFTKIRPSEITDREIVLTNVSPEFAIALDEYELDEAQDDYDDEYRRLGKPMREDRDKRSGRRPPKSSTDITGDEPD
jgi:hypothetical protein